ncbi:exodeoxyribonuclease III [bacterium]|nr:exodeoxyribonuclease III [bacterium]
MGKNKSSLKLISWNVNGIRAIHKKGFLKWFTVERPDILCLQETKAWEEQFPTEILEWPGYHKHFSQPERKGYSGVATFSRLKPGKVIAGLGTDKFDNEGRVLVSDFGDFILFNIYFPNGKASPQRLQYKMDFYEAFLRVLDKYRDLGKKLLVCGDLNTAHKEIDLARPRDNEKVSGFLPEERAWIDKFISHGYTDTFRIFHKGGDHYSWWDYKTRARDRNVGWRIDYFFCSNNLADHIEKAFILPRVMGSDHCPIGIILNTRGLGNKDPEHN